MRAPLKLAELVHSSLLDSTIPASMAQATQATVRCVHYRRNCNLVAPCCGRVVCCHQGHDAHSCGTSLDRTRHRVKQVVCCSCKKIQPVGNTCRYCPRSFGENGCIPCRMWYSGDGYHCDECGICRKGKKRDMRHCAVCKVCYPIHRNGANAQTHTCAINATHRPCAGCGKDMSRSRRPCTTMRCGHSMHCDCFLQRVQTNYACPRRECRKTVANMQDWYRALESVAASQHATHQTSEVSISCINCRATSRVRTNGNYRKCPSCGSNNTVRLPTNLPFSLPPATLGKRR